MSKKMEETDRLDASSAAFDSSSLQRTRRRFKWLMNLQLGGILVAIGAIAYLAWILEPGSPSDVVVGLLALHVVAVSNYFVVLLLAREVFPGYRG